MLELAIIGGGPAGLRAAEVASSEGISVTLFDAKPSVGRKLLVAGKGGLNLTHGEPLETFTTRYQSESLQQQSQIHFWTSLLNDFSPPALREWASDLGIETFQATSGRVYPAALKAAPLLRRWVARLKESGVRFEMNHRLTEIGGGDGLVPSFHLHFENQPARRANAVIFALGGASWPQTGSDGRWTSVLGSLGIQITPLAPANCGWEHEWPAELTPIIEGQPLKNLHVRAAGQLAVGELLITKYGLEGGAIYQLGATLRAMENPAIAIDFKPTFTVDQLVSKIPLRDRESPDSLLNRARQPWKLSDPAYHLLSRKFYPDIQSLARETKHHLMPLLRPRPIAEAISTAGGVSFSELDENLMLKKFPGLFVAGEMIDWEAPTGGYLLQGCFATATRAANAANVWLKQSH